MHRQNNKNTMKSFTLKLQGETLNLTLNDGKVRYLDVVDKKSNERAMFMLSKADGCGNKPTDILGTFVGILNEVTSIDEYDLNEPVYPLWEEENGTGLEEYDKSYFQLIMARWTELQKLSLFKEGWQRKDLFEFCDSLLQTISLNALRY